MRLFLRVFFLTLFIQSCYTPEKAQKQQDKILRKHPEVAAEKIRSAFPCITTNIDSAGYIESISTLDSLLNETRVKYIESSDRFQQIRDSLENVLNSDSTMKCEEENKALLDYASGLQVRNEKLEKENKRTTDIINTISKQLKDIKPVIVRIEDSAKIYTAIRAQVKAENDAIEWKAKYDIDHEWREKKEKQEKGKVIIRIPWLWIGILLALLGLSIFSKLKIGTFNILKFFLK